MHPTPAPPIYFDPSKNKVHILGFLLILCMDLGFSFVCILVWLVQLEKKSNFSLTTMLDFTMS
jgi:hypothetical protein